MTKKFLGIFKRDKTGFSNEELEWQAKIGRKVKIIAIVISCIVGMYLIPLEIVFLGKFYKSDMNNYIGATTFLIILTLVVYLITIIVMVVIFKMFKQVFRCEETNAQLQKNREEINAQLQENLKEKKKEKILSCLEKRDFLELGIDWPMIDSFFRLFLICGMIEIIPSSDGVKVSISKSIQDNPSFSINRDELLDYFDVDDDEEK